MPKELFFTISDEKQNRVINAALTEFSDKVYNDVSINQIIKNADISRGSFYQYFHDKEDLCFYIIEEFLNVKIKVFANKVNPENEDIFSIYRKIFLYNLSIFSETNYQSFFKNFYLSLNYGFQQRFKILTDRLRDDISSGNFNELIWSFGEKKQFVIEILKIIELINRDLLLMKIVENVDDKKIMLIYDTRMDLLRGKIDL